MLLIIVSYDINFLFISYLNDIEINTMYPQLQFSLLHDLRDYDSTQESLLFDSTNSTSNKNTAGRSKKWSWIKIFDLTSSIISAIALFVALFLVCFRYKSEYVSSLTDSNTILFPLDQSKFDAYQHKETYHDVCLNTETAGKGNGLSAFNDILGGLSLSPILAGMWNPDYTLKVSTILATYNNVTYKGSTVHTEGGSWNRMWVLIYIFSISVIFQFTRYRTYDEEYKAEEKEKDLGDTILSWRYNPLGGPDLGRWVEYALTAPFQIVIIASTFLVDDFAFLSVVGALQGALMYMGYTIELTVEKLMQLKLKKKNSWLVSLHLSLLLLSAWIMHSIIWYTLIERFLRQDKNIDACNFTEKMPPWVKWIVFGEFFLFSLFGCVLTTQVLYVQMSSFAAYKNEESVKWIWQRATLWYTVLSVAAKTFLEVGFLGLVHATPDVEVVSR